MGTTVETLGGNFASWGELMTSAYSAFGKAIVTGTNVTVDDLGISTENMTNAMFESMQETAKQQVEFLDGQIAMLEGIKAISELDAGELEGGFDSILQTMTNAVNEYNAETGSEVKLDNIFITVGGERFPFTEEGLAKAQEKYNELFSDSGISFEKALQTSLGNNFGVVMEGGTIGITPTGVMEVELSVDGAAITDSLSETNGYLTNINSSLITIVGLLSTGKNPWTAEGAAAYFRDEEGNSVIPQTPEELREWYANLDPISQAIYRNYEKTSGIPFEYSPIASADGYQEGEYGKNTYTITTADGEKITGQKVIIETIDGKATPTYATGLDESGKGVAYMALPENPQDWWRNNGAIGRQYTSLLDKGYFQDGEHWYRIDPKSGSKISVDDTDEVKAYNASLETYLSSAEATPWIQALYYTMIGQPEKVPGYGVSGKGYTTPDPSTSVDVNTLLERTNSELDSIVANTAEAKDILSAMSLKMDLSKEADAKNYLKTYRGFNEDWQTDSEGFKTWWQGASETDRKLWRQFYSNPETAAQAANWGASTNEAVIVAVDWEENGLPEDDIEDIQEFWIEAYGTEEVPFSEEWEQYRQQIQVSPEDGNYAYYQNGNYIIDEEGYVWEKDASGGKGVAIRDNTEWDWDRLLQSPEFLSWLSGTEIGRQYYTENTSTPEPQTRVLTEGEKTTRENWFNSLTPAEQGNFLTSLGYTGIEYTHDANGITGISSYGTAAQTGTPGAVNLDAILANSGFEKQYAIAIGGIFDKFYEGINQYRDLAAKAIELDGYEQRDGNWYKKGETTAVDSDTAARLTENQAALANGALDNLEAQLQAWASILGIQFDPNMLYEAGANSLTNDAILRTTSKVDEAMAQLQSTMSDVSTYISTLTTANLIPEMPQFSPENIEELVNLGIIDQNDVNTWLDAINEAYRAGDTAGVNEANSAFEETVRAGHQEYENELTTQINDLTTQLNTANESVTTLTADKAALEADKEELEGRLATAEANLAEAQAGLDAANATLQERQARVDELNQNYQNLISQQADLNQQLTDARAAGDQAAVVRLTGEIAALQTNITAVETAMTVAESELRSAEAQVETWEQAVETAQTEKTKILDSLSAVSAALAETNANLAETYSTIAELEQLLSEKEAALAAANRALAEYEANSGNQEAADVLNQTATDLEESSTQHADNSSEARNAALQAEILADPLRAYGSSYVEGGSLSPFLEQTGLTVLDMVQAYDRKNGDLSYLNADDFPLMHAYGSYVNGWGNLSALHGLGINVNTLDPRIIDGLLNFGSYENGWLHTNNSLWAEDEEAYQSAFTAAKDSNDPLAMVRFIADYYGMDIPDFARVESEVTQPPVETEVESPIRPPVEPPVETAIDLPVEIEVEPPVETEEDEELTMANILAGADPDIAAEIYISAGTETNEPPVETEVEPFSIEDYLAPYKQLEEDFLQPINHLEFPKLLQDELYERIDAVEIADSPEQQEEALENLREFGQAYSEVSGYLAGEFFSGVETLKEAKQLLSNLSTLGLIDEDSEWYAPLTEALNSQDMDLINITFGQFLNEFQSQMLQNNQFTDPWEIFQLNLSGTSEQLSSSASTIDAAANTMNIAANRLAGTQIQVKIIGGAVAVATGNVSGLAFAEGNNSLDRLNAGARLAGKTLVGELGPELAVYDGMYHLLGQNGAEFVDLPSNAIVFNHRQTAGIIRGQVGYRGKALAEGNVDDLITGEAFAEGHITGPARASIDDTIGQLKALREMWQSIVDATVEDLVSAGGGGGGGGSTAKAVTAELQEWYNLMRKIEYLTQEIANLESKRANILEKEGEAYLRNLRQTQALLEEQKFAQQILVEYQQAQLERQAAHINEHSIWGRFLKIDENGLLQYIDGNEDNGGKGALDVLAKLNDMSAEQQEKYVKSLGYSATDEEGEALEGADLVQQFFEDFQAQIDEYDGLYDTVHQTEEEIQSLISEAAEIEKEILENQKELEEEIYDIIVEGFEESIEELKEYTDLVKEANEEYVKGLKEALDAEKDMYDQNESISDRESLQRQLSLLRRSGGSASEIADLEEQLNDSLKDEYFSNQEKMIENIEDANEEQVRKLEEQIRLQEEALEYQKENGIIWTEVYKVLDGTKAEILAFMQGNAPDFFSKSSLAQKQALDEWSHKIGIFTEDRIYKSNFETADFGFENWDIWNSDSLQGLEETYNEATEEQQATGRKYFNQVYANALMEGATEEEAKEKASKALGEYLGRKFNDDGSYKDTGNIGQKPTQSFEQDKKLYYGGYALDGTFHGGASKFVYGNEALARQFATDSHTQPPIAVNKAGYFKTGSSPINPWKKWYIEDGNGNKLSATGYATKEQAEAVINKYKKIAEDNQKEVAQARAERRAPQVTPLTENELRYTRAVAKLYSKGGLVDYTGVAIVHGSKSKPESFLNAEQTAQIKEALQATNGKENLLEGLHSTIAELRSLIHNISTTNNSTNNNITVAPGAVVIQVEQLADSYDVEALSADVMNRMVAIASKATNRGVNRR